jgi:hypothetical protein
VYLPSGITDVASGKEIMFGDWPVMADPDWMYGLWVSVVAYFLIVGLILSARALRTK